MSNLVRVFLGIMIVVAEVAGCHSPNSVNINNNIPSISTSQPTTNFVLAHPNSLTRLEQEIHQQVNQYRLSRHLPPLKLNQYISQQARIHSQRMASESVPFSHNGFEQRVKIIGKKIAYQKAAENLAFNQGYANPATIAVQGWIESPGHRKNMEGQFDLTGIGIAKNAKGEYYFTQIFILKR